jgi:hypothetical protein
MEGPMRFTVYGVIEDRTVELVWQDGRLTGDRAAVEEVCALSLVLEGRPVGPEPEGPFSREDHLQHPLSTWMLIEDVLDEVTACTGDLPELIRQAA